MRLTTRSQRRLTVRLGVVALIVVALALILARDGTPSYADQLKRICARAYEPLRTTHGNYFENVVMVSSLKHQRLTQLTPPAEHAAFHRALVRREWQMFEDATLAQQRVAGAVAVGGAQAVDPREFPELRAAQAKLDGWYRRLGVQHCSD